MGLASIVVMKVRVQDAPGDAVLAVRARLGWVDEVANGRGLWPGAVTSLDIAEEKLDQEK